MVLKPDFPNNSSQTTSGTPESKPSVPSAEKVVDTPNPSTDKIVALSFSF